MNAEEWVRRFATAVGSEPPSDDEVDQMLKLAAIAAHGSERTAAPVACWIGAKSGLPLEELRKLAKGVNPGGGD
jgi:uncharacterized protein DUF6457